MPIKNPPHPGLSVRDDCIEALGMTIAEAAAHLQVDCVELEEVCQGRAPITADLAIRIDMAFGGDADLWLRLQTNHDMVQARKRASSVRIKRLWPLDEAIAATD